MKRFFTVTGWLYLVITCVLVNSYLLLESFPHLWYAVVPAFLALNIFAGALRPRTESRRIQVCRHGVLLLFLFLISLVVSLIYHAVLAFYTFPETPMRWVWSAVVCFVAEFVLFWNGMICIYCASYQLGVKWRVIGALCGWLPVVNLIVLGKMLRCVMAEVDFELQKEGMELARRDEAVCRTRYPILLVHGVFFRDFKHFNYWGRVPKTLMANGAAVYYGEHPSAQSVADSAAFLAKRIRQVAEESGCGKVNIIAHSKGGLDCRYALSKLGVESYVASLTTVNSPHRGCRFADYLLKAAPQSLRESIADAYNKTLTALGDSNPDFLAAVGDLTEEACEARNQTLSDPKGIFYQSVGSVMRVASSGQFPLNFSYHLAHYFDGPNDGLVCESSFSFGERYQLVTVKDGRGVSHGDMIDLNRENLAEFDVREFYVELVNDLKQRGL